MRKLFSVVAVLGLAAAASAQTIPIGGVNCNDFTDGTAENSWKVNAPTTSGDFFSMDFDATVTGSVIAACVMTNETGAGGANGEVGIYPDNLTVSPAGDTPDLSAPLSNLVSPTGLPGTGCGTYTAYDIPDITLSGTSVHVGYTQAGGDSVTWLCSDTGPNFGRSYFTTNSYSTPAIPFTITNWFLGIGTRFSDFTLLINGGSSATVNENGGAVNIFVNTTAGNASAAVLLQFIVPGFPPVFSPIVFLTDSSGQLNLSGTLPCVYFGATFVVDVSAYCEDKTDLKPSGKSKIKLTTSARMTVTSDGVCYGIDVCFGLKDDTTLDSTIWKVQNPAGTRDWFGVNHGADQTAQVTSITGVEVASWDFCGSTQSWAAVGVYPADLARDSSGLTPDTTNPLTTAGGAGATMAANASDWTYPATFYDVPDANLGGDTTTEWTGLTLWDSGDTCVWLGSDTNGTSDDGGDNCGVLPNSTSFFTADGFVTNGVPFSTANWMIKIDWN